LYDNRKIEEKYIENVCKLMTKIILIFMFQISHILEGKQEN